MMIIKIVKKEKFGIKIKKNVFNLIKNVTKENIIVLKIQYVRKNQIVFLYLNILMNMLKNVY